MQQGNRVTLEPSVSLSFQERSEGRRRNDEFKGGRAGKHDASFRFSRMINHFAFYGCTHEEKGDGDRRMPSLKERLADLTERDDRRLTRRLRLADTSGKAKSRALRLVCISSVVQRNEWVRRSGGGERDRQRNDVTSESAAVLAAPAAAAHVLCHLQRLSLSAHAIAAQRVWEEA